MILHSNQWPRVGRLQEDVVPMTHHIAGSPFTSDFSPYFGLQPWLCTPRDVVCYEHAGRDTQPPQAGRRPRQCGPELCQEGRCVDQEARKIFIQVVSEEGRKAKLDPLPDGYDPDKDDDHPCHGWRPEWHS